MTEKQYPELPDFEAVEQHIYGACRRFVARDMLEPIHNLIRDGIDADRDMRDERIDELEQLLAEAYQVVGVLLSDTDQFDTDHGTKILDNLSQMRQVHSDVLPWESRAMRAAPQGEIAEREAFESIFKPDSGVTFDRNEYGFYKGVFVSEAWKVWQARAALSQPQEVAPYDHGPQAETLEEAARDVGKWLNERPNRPIDLRHVAMLVHHAQAAPSQDAARELFDAGWKAAARFCDREDVVADGIIGGSGCPQFEQAYEAARAKQEKK